MKSIAIIGAGLAGTLLSLYMARRGYSVELFESRPDVRTEKADRGRSINLALSCRGITGLASINLMPVVEKIMVPMRARAIHESSGEIKFQPFGRHEGEYINAIHRNELNALLLDEAQREPLIRIYFNMRLVDLNLDKKLLCFKDKDENERIKSYDLLIGADGVASGVREALVKRKLVDASRDFLPHGYKELTISRSHSTEFVREHLHLWPRNSFMLLGNPNHDGSITGTLFLANEGKNSFATLDNEAAINAFFKKEFPDAYQAMPDLPGEFFNHPTGSLSTIKCSPWYYDAQCLLIGDAAHGIVPFFGQGMNSAFEDCRILNKLLDEYKDDWSQVMPAFFRARKVNTDAVAEMSMDNYHEIQSAIRNEKFNLKKKLEQVLMQRYPNRYISKHVLVMFTNIPYSRARAYGHFQQEMLDELCEDIKSIEEINWGKVDNLMEQYDKNLANLNA
ncbi:MULTISPECIES: NAD(P)/FAD-dependent oxidoreductase [unclassified Legionella]|uniref:FAD-dependent oxidoreductase n=1 Tax=unclassified Legionella TaxID=2622702 RepID=UPI001055D58E|nr:MULTISPECIES: NAD(P)/FAD-dependent oxidoreductase [unclassified Legionella]MDI9818321.1 NAD(P)/FAD-dependent oxidoreductase [Legionella sp. PL877]